MSFVRRWIRRRRATLALVGFFASWYALELVVAQRFGEATARWWFYTELPPRLTGGVVFSPISHDLSDLSHIGANLLLLLGVGGVAEPHIGTWKVPGLVVIGGYVGTVVTMATAVFHQFWPMAGASTGILLLWGYCGVRLWHEREAPADITGLEDTAAFVLVAGILAIPLYELLLSGNMSHLIGIVLGVLYYCFETLGSSAFLD